MTSIFEYNKEEEEKKLRKAEYEQGVAHTMINAVEKIVRKTGQTVAEACELLDYSVEEYETAKKLFGESYEN